MTDKISTPGNYVSLVAMSYGAEGADAIPVTSGNPLPVSGGSAGAQDTDNSTTTPLGSSATYTGTWVTDNAPQFGFNLYSDQDGTFYVEFSPDGGTTLTLSKKYDILAGESRFDVLVKFPGRSHRVRFVNGATAQTTFVLFSVTGTGIFPFAVSERDEPVFVAYQSTAVAADTYAILVDLSDTTSFPHSDKGRIDIYSSFLFVDKAANTVGEIQIGVITRVDGTNADVAYVQGASFNSTSDRSFARDRVLTAPIKLGQSGGALTKASTEFVETSVTAINTGITLPSSEGNVTPAVGDVVVKFSYTSGGAYDGTASIQYAAVASTA